ncbi:MULTISPECIES: flagellar basal-body rod protein FlgF [Duganella]|uniref:Flagellar basal-body rod protein FlgF n=1 Tax=Duganella zoogloeoides TaxID=75659 RepID=A0ABZ0Y2V8_9BURK|nr:MULTISPECIES: flagellar basal-body rod protein FlgF [Duganella]KQN75493.1 flagellar biosynthesis protein FlgF [Duganella sp. Leaf61]MPQ56964.1 flagellar basal-body rod protein FlgF [Duganella sp. FT27W]WQH05690.1 flagellar basal-body rod protein FlgF [Duganella zoogloeoides]
MDRLIYTAMTGARHVMEQQATVSNNLANATTNGFRAQLDSFRAVPVMSDGLPTRAFVVDSTVGSNFTAGPMQTTGRALDIAIREQGWLAVQSADGSEAYTRNGSLRVNENGLLQTTSGQTLIGDGGPIAVPPDTTITIASDGTVSTVSNEFQPGPSNVLGRLKLVNPPTAGLLRGDDGLFRQADGTPAQNDPAVRIVDGVIEGSNVNPVDSMVNMISLARQFDMQMSLLKNAENNAAKATQILALG